MIKISKELEEKLINTASDVDACKLLADNGIDPEEYEKSLPDSFLNKVNGGYKSLGGTTIKCPWCQNDDEKEISYQIWASMWTDGVSKYRCCKCENTLKSVLTAPPNAMTINFTDRL